MLVRTVHKHTHTFKQRVIKFGWFNIPNVVDRVRKAVVWEKWSRTEHKVTINRCRCASANITTSNEYMCVCFGCSSLNLLNKNKRNILGHRCGVSVRCLHHVHLSTCFVIFLPLHLPYHQPLLAMIRTQSTDHHTLHYFETYYFPWFFPLWFDYEPFYLSRIIIGKYSLFGVQFKQFKLRRNDRCLFAIASSMLCYITFHVKNNTPFYWVYSNANCPTPHIQHFGHFDRNSAVPFPIPITITLFCDVLKWIHLYVLTVVVPYWVLSFENPSKSCCAYCIRTAWFWLLPFFPLFVFGACKHAASKAQTYRILVDVKSWCQHQRAIQQC